MKRTSDRDLIAQARNIAERSEHLFAHVEENLRRIDEWSAAASSSPTGEGVRGGDVSTPTERRAVPNHKRCNLPHNHTRSCSPDVWREDPFVRVRSSLELRLKAVDGALSSYEATARRLSIMDQDEARKLAEDDAITGSECTNRHCQSWIPGTPENRSRSGRCKRCFDWWVDHGRTDDRPHRLVHRSPEPDCAQCRKAAA